MKIDNIVYLDDKEDQIVTEVICLNCKKRWLNVRPITVWQKNMECKYCEEQGTVINTSETIDDETFKTVCEKYPKLNIYREKRFMYKYD